MKYRKTVVIFGIAIVLISGGLHAASEVTEPITLTPAQMPKIGVLNEKPKVGVLDKKATGLQPLADCRSDEVPVTTSRMTAYRKSDLVEGTPPTELPPGMVRINADLYPGLKKGKYYPAADQTRRGKVLRPQTTCIKKKAGMNANDP